jgi:hypothetical protein
MAMEGSTHRQMRSTHRISVQKLEGKKQVSTDIHSKIILKWILKKLHGHGLNSSGTPLKGSLQMVMNIQAP